MDMTSFIIGYEAGKNSVEKGPETEETTVTLNLSAGDQVVTPSGEDKAFSQVTIRKPETLIPGNIAQGVDIAGVLGTLTGGSGGALPVGVYLGCSDVFLNPTSQTHKRFMFNGELFASCYPGSGDGYLQKIYKWNGTKWETLLTTSAVADVAGGTMDAVSWFGVVFNGELHMIESKQHHIFNGKTLTKSVECPKNYSIPFVWQDKLYVYACDYGEVYEWDEANSAWNLFASLSLYTAYPLVVNNDLYFTKSKTVYKYDNGALTTHGTSPVSIYKPYRVVNNSVYCYYDHSWYEEWYRVNIDTMEYTVLGKHPSFASLLFTENADELSFVGKTNSPSSTNPFFKINIVEATE